MSAQDDLKAAVEKAVDAMNKAADFVRNHSKAGADTAATESAMSDAAAQLVAASESLTSDIPAADAHVGGPASPDTSGPVATPGASPSAPDANTTAPATGPAQPLPPVAP